MPDYQMPYGDFNQLPQMQQQQYNDPAAAFVNYNYAQNNQAIMNYGQSNMQMTMQIAQNNFQQHMMEVMQGTMQAAMAVYNTGQLAHEKSREHLYKDQLLNNTGAYALERSLSRDIAWMSGLANTDFGRALQIGGRRPEFVSGPEYEFQMRRSAHHRASEFGDMAIGGLSAVPGFAVGMMSGNPLAGYLTDEIFGMAVKPVLERRRATRDMAMFTEMADLNRGIGQRRMSEEASDQLASRFFEKDVTAWKYVPLVGDSLAERLGPKVKYADTFKKMAQLDLLRDVNPDDIDKIEKRVKDTIGTIDKMAGLLNTTRDGVLQLKGRLNQLGMNEGQQNVALNNISNLRLATGYSAETGVALYSQFTEMGRQMGYYNVNFKPGQGQGDFAAHEMMAVAALKESGLVSRNINVAETAMNRYMSAVQANRTPWGQVVEKGGGDVFRAMSVFTSMGNGSPVLGMELENLDIFGNKRNPFESRRNMVQTTAKMLEQNGTKKSDILAFLLRQATTKEEKQQVFEMFSGYDLMMAEQGQVGVVNRELERRGEIVKGSTFKIKDILDIASKGGDFGFGQDTGSNTDRSIRRGTTRDVWNSVVLGSTITREGNRQAYEKYEKFVKDGGSFGQSFLEHNKLSSKNIGYKETLDYYNKVAAGTATAEDESKLLDFYQGKWYVGSRDEAVGFKNLAMQDLERKFGKIDKNLKEQGVGSLWFIENYGKGRIALRDDQQRLYSTIMKEKSSLSKEEAQKLKTKYENASSDEERAAIIKEAGFLKLGNNSTFETEVAKMAFEDFVKGKVGLDITPEKQKLAKAFTEQYETMSKDSNLVAKYLTDEKGNKITAQGYAERYLSQAGILGKEILKGDKLNVKSTANALNYLLHSSDPQEGERLANTLISLGDKERKILLQNITNQDIGVLGENVKRLKEGKSLIESDQDKALSEFTKVLEQLAKVLGTPNK